MDHFLFANRKESGQPEFTAGPQSGDFAIQLGVCRAVHRPRAAFAELGGDAIVSDH
jgi:hypothetical protein